MICGAGISDRGLSCGREAMLPRARQILVSELAPYEQTNEDKGPRSS